AALEHVRVPGLHGADDRQRGGHPAPDAVQHAALPRQAGPRALLAQRPPHPAGAVDEEEHGHLPVERGILGELLLVAVLDLVVVLLDDAVDHVAGEPAHDRGATGQNPRLVLAASAQTDVAVAAAAVSAALGSEPADPQRVSTA